MPRTIIFLATIVAAAALGLVACFSGASTSFSIQSSSESSAAASEIAQVTQPSSTTAEVNDGSVETKLSVTHVVSLDNHTFEVLQQWNVQLVAAPKKLIPATITTFNGEDAADAGMRHDPNLEALVAAELNLIIPGQYFFKFDMQVKEFASDILLINPEPREDKPFNEELTREVTKLGEIFGKQDKARKLVDDLSVLTGRAKKAYDGSSIAMVVDASGDNIGYAVPDKGHTWGPVFDLLGLRSAPKTEGATDSHTGNDIPVEATAETNPAWISVLDHDAVTTKGGSNAPVETVINGDAALQNIAVLQNKHAVYAPNDTYTSESIITYMEIFSSIADAFEAAKK